jgi:hypothetical protein
MAAFSRKDILLSGLVKSGISVQMIESSCVIVLGLISIPLAIFGFGDSRYSAE